MWSRRDFLSRTLGSAAVFPFSRLPRLAPSGFDVRGSLPDPSIGWHGESAFSLGTRATLDRIVLQPGRRRNPASPDYSGIGADLRGRHRDLRRHFVFEYYPWYAADPVRHWDLWDRKPPGDIAATSVPRLGTYDSRSRSVLEQHARWIAEAGVGAVNLSWWGQGSFEDRAVPLVMDVMRDHDIHVTFHLEPYRTDRVASYADDVLFLVREYGEKRHWDCFLLLEDADGRVGPVFKSFRTIVPPETTDCHGLVSSVPDWVPDTTWRRQTDTVRDTLRPDFDHVTLLADVSDVGRMATAGFDGLAIYDAFVRPTTWRGIARVASDRDQVFSFNVNAGFDGIHLRTVDPDSCYVPTPIEPAGTYDWSRTLDRDRAAHRSLARIAESFATTLGLQTDRTLANYRSGFFLVYVNTFNEWHEGTQFEPMKDAADLSPAELQAGYHNAAQGDYRIGKLEELLGMLGR